MLDTIGPTFIQKSGPESGAIVPSAAIEIVDSVGDPSDIDSVYWTKNGGAKKMMASVSGSVGHYSLKDTLTEGKIDTLVVTGVDKATRKNRTTQAFYLRYIKAPSITTQPLSQAVCSGGQAIFTISATGTAPLSYQWRTGAAAPFNNIAGNFPACTLNNVSATTILSCVVSNGSGTNVTSSLCTLTVNALPHITSISQAPSSVYQGAEATFSVSVSSDVSIWRWYRGSVSGSPIGTSATYKTATAGTYYCVVSNGNCADTSSGISLNAGYSVTYLGNGNETGTVPVDTNVYPQNAVASIKANTGSLVRIGSTFSGWNLLQNGTGKTYQPSDTLLIGAANVQLFAKWNIDSFTVSFNSNGGSAVVLQKIVYGGYAAEPTIPTRTGFAFAGWFSNQSLTALFDFATAITAPRTLYAKWNPVFTVTYNANGGSGAVPVDTNKYQNGQIVSVLGAGSLSRTNYTFAGWNTQADTLGTNFGVTFPMGNANVVLFAKWRMNAPVVTTQPGSTTRPVNDSVTFRVVASGAGLSYQWQKNNGNIEGATSASFTPPALTVDDTAGAATYRCVVSNAGGSVTSNGATLAISTLTDADGNVYHQVKIGNQIWTMENLRVTKYGNGTSIPKGTSATTWEANATTPQYCYYNNTSSADSIKKFGALYNWYVVDPVNSNRIAPAGWHVPSDAEWGSLENYMIASGYNWDGTTTGNKIAKALAAKTDWTESAVTGSTGNNLQQNNNSGFSAFPGGIRDNVGTFFVQGSYGDWWSTTDDVAPTAWRSALYFDYDGLDRASYNKSCGFSVRLIKD
jgi:uncharacterized protein (TIGR02145 family)/uncharacterized repeat protein (TIGR02543 family)